jgi:hypothetical protein
VFYLNTSGIGCVSIRIPPSCSIFKV